MYIRKNNKKKIIQEKQVYKDGNLLNHSLQYASKTEDAYVKMYLRDILYLTGLSHYHYEILFSIIKRIDFNNKTVILLKQNKEEIAKETGLQYGTIHNSIHFLKTHEILIPKSRGCYLINPFIFSVGDWKDINNIRAEIVWNKNGKTIKTIMEENKK